MRALVCSVIFLVFGLSQAWALFNRCEGIEAARINDAAVSPYDSVLYVSSPNTLYKSQDNAKSFEKLKVFKDEEIKQVVFDSLDPRKIYVATTRHLFSISDDFLPLFTADDEEIIFTGAVYQGGLFIGTSQGLYFSKDKLAHWEKLKKISQMSVYSLCSTQNELFIAGDKGVYLLSGNNAIKRLFVLRQSKDDETLIKPTVVWPDFHDPEKIWLGTDRGLFVSKDSGDHWQKLYYDGIYGLAIKDVAQATQEKDCLYLGTDHGLFKLDLASQVSRQVSEGLYSPDVSKIVFTRSGRIFLATAQGLFWAEDEIVPAKEQTWDELAAGEPSIQEIQQAAVRYNDVHPEKIKQWRDKLKYKALFPSLNLDYSKTIFGTAGTNTYDGKAYVGPRDWSVGLSWDVSELVWNSHEDDVDTRSRLDTQLRMDVLDEINRVYFERMRLRKELCAAGADNEELFKRQLRLKELTAMLDGYTGGFFSQQIKKSPRWTRP